MGEKPIKNTDVKVAAVLTDSTNQPNSLQVCYMVMLKSLPRDQSLGLTPEVQERGPGHSRRVAVPLLLTEQLFL